MAVTVRVRIDHIVAEGWTERDVRTFVTALETGLTERVRARGVSSVLPSVVHPPASVLAPLAGETPAVSGEALAVQLFQTFGDDT